MGTDTTSTSKAPAPAITVVYVWTLYLVLAMSNLCLRPSITINKDKSGGLFGNVW